eukprot:3120450-Lingulodinium_polyedra.AAC.1
MGNGNTPSRGGLVGGLVVAPPHCQPARRPAVARRTAQAAVQDSVQMRLGEAPRASAEPDNPK